MARPVYMCSLRVISTSDRVAESPVPTLPAPAPLPVRPTGSQLMGTGSQLTEWHSPSELSDAAAGGPCPMIVRWGLRMNGRLSLLSPDTETPEWYNCVMGSWDVGSPDLT